MRAAALLPAGAAVAWCGPALAMHVPPLAGVLGIPLRLPLGAGVALTFDDGPHPQGTVAVLEVLREHGARATFFLVGEQVRRTGSLASEIAAAGHDVAVHGDRHRNLMRLGPRAVRTDLDRAAETIAGAAGSLRPVHRPPYGIYTPAALAEVRRRGWRPLLWSRWGRDWRARATPAGIAREAGAGLGAGDVVLLHDADDYSAPGSWRATVAALPRILESVAAAGLETATAGAAATPPAAAPAPAGSTAARTNGARPPSR